MASMDIALGPEPQPGFAEPVAQSQEAFRAVLQAFSRPGVPVVCAPLVAALHGLDAAVAAALLALTDLDTPVWVGPGLDAGVADWLRFHTGAPLAADPATATFALVQAEGPWPSLDSFALGSDEAPEIGATLLVQGGRLDRTTAMQWQGPGIREAVETGALGLPATVWRQRRALEGLFPRGIDLLIGCGSQLVGCPRSTRISLREGA